MVLFELNQLVNDILLNVHLNSRARLVLVPFCKSSEKSVHFFEGANHFIILDLAINQNVQILFNNSFESVRSQLRFSPDRRINQISTLSEMFVVKVKRLVLIFSALRKVFSIYVVVINQ